MSASPSRIEIVGVIPTLWHRITLRKYLHRSPTDLGFTAAGADPTIVLQQLPVYSHELRADHLETQAGGYR